MSTMKNTAAEHVPSAARPGLRNDEMGAGEAACALDLGAARPPLVPFGHRGVRVQEIAPRVGAMGHDMARTDGWDEPPGGRSVTVASLRQCMATFMSVGFKVIGQSA